MRTVREKLEIALKRRGYNPTNRRINCGVDLEKVGSLFYNPAKPEVQYLLTEDGDLWCNYRSQLKDTMLGEVRDVDAIPPKKKFDPLQLLD